MNNVLEFLQKNYYCHERTASDMNVLDYESVLTEIKNAWTLAEHPDKEKFACLRHYQIILCDVIFYKRRNSYYRILRNFVNSPQDPEDFESLYGDISHLRSMYLRQLDRYEKNFDLIKSEAYTPKVDYFSEFIRLTFNILEGCYMAEDLDSETEDSIPEEFYEQIAFNEAKPKIFELYYIMVNQYFDNQL